LRTGISEIRSLRADFLFCRHTEGGGLRITAQIKEECFGSAALAAAGDIQAMRSGRYN
jgi:hypothetical protein